MFKLTSICNIISICLLIFIIICSVIIFTSNDIIPTHWGLSGHIDSYGKSYSVFIDLFITIFMYLLLRFIEKHPQFCNLPWSFSNQKEKAFSLIQLNLAVLNLLFLVFMSYMSMATYINANINMLIIALIGILGIFITVCCFKSLSKLHKKSNVDNQTLSK